MHQVNYSYTGKKKNYFRYVYIVWESLNKTFFSKTALYFLSVLSFVFLYIVHFTKADH